MRARLEFTTAKSAAYKKARPDAEAPGTWRERLFYFSRSGADAVAPPIDRARIGSCRPSGWFNLHERATKSLVALALRLRLGPQSRADKAPKTLPAAEMSYYERISFEEGADDDGVDRGRS
jgi:hypothetical protein